MPKLEPRKQTIQSEIEYQLRPLMSSEAVEVQARVMAHIIARDPRQFTQLTDLFKHAFASEHGYLSSRQTSTGPDSYHRSTSRTGVS
jgi:hypothetical protein